MNRAVGSSQHSVMVTGGTGLIGRHAVAALANRGWRVTAVGRSIRPEHLDPRAIFISTDMTMPDACRTLFANGAPDVLLHLAWYTEHGKFWNAPENLDWLAASVRLVRAFAEAGGKRVVAAGTCVEYAPPEHGPCVPGVTPLAPVHLYAVAKDAFRRVLEAYAREHNMTFAWGRVFLVTGAGEFAARLVPSMARSILSGIPAQCSSGRQIRDVLDVRDAGEAFSTLAVSDRSGAVNVSSGKPVTLAEVARLVGDLLKRPDLVKLGALPDRPGEPGNLWGDPNALADLGFEPRYALADALTSAINDWRDKEGLNSTERSRRSGL